MKGMGQMDIEKILLKYDEMIAKGDLQAAAGYLEKKAAQCGEEGYSTSAITIFNELEGFWRAAGDKEKSYAAAEAALGLIASCKMEGRRILNVVPECSWLVTSIFPPCTSMIL